MAAQPPRQVLMVRQHYLNRPDAGTRGVLLALSLCSTLALSLASTTQTMTPVPITHSSSVSTHELEDIAGLLKPVIVASDAVAVPNIPFTLTCQSIDLNPPDIQWHLPSIYSKSDIEFSEMSYKFPNGTAVKSITIILNMNNTLTDSIWRCTSRRTDTPRTLMITNYALHINYHPQFKYIEKNWNPGIGGNGYIHCVFDAKPIADIVWYHNGSQLSSETNRITFSQIHLEPNQVKYILSIDGITYKDFGNYTCEAKNNIGTASVNGSVTITMGSRRIGDRCLEDVDCFISGSFCQDRHWCVCKETYIPITTPEEDKCLHKRNITQSCEVDTQCIRWGSVCEQGICVCQTGLLENNGRCWFPKMAGDYCTSDEECLRGGAVNTKCQLHKCTCLEGYRRRHAQEGCALTKDNDIPVEVPVIVSACLVAAMAVAICVVLVYSRKSLPIIIQRQFNLKNKESDLTSIVKEESDDQPKKKDLPPQDSTVYESEKPQEKNCESSTSQNRPSVISTITV